eukprot:7388984-Prymnesium_polylepis.1
MNVCMLRTHVRTGGGRAGGGAWPCAHRQPHARRTLRSPCGSYAASTHRKSGGGERARCVFAGGGGGEPARAGRPSRPRQPADRLPRLPRRRGARRVPPGGHDRLAMLHLCAPGHGARLYAWPHDPRLRERRGGGARAGECRPRRLFLLALLAVGASVARGVVHQLPAHAARPHAHTAVGSLRERERERERDLRGHIVRWRASRPPRARSPHTGSARSRTGAPTDRAFGSRRPHPT